MTIIGTKNSLFLKFLHRMFCIWYLMSLNSQVTFIDENSRRNNIIWSLTDLDYIFTILLVICKLYKFRGLLVLTNSLNSSEISLMKVEICFINRSTDDSEPVFSNVVMANVAIERFESVIKFSRSRLHAVTAEGCFIATCLKSKSIWIKNTKPERNYALS